MSEVTTGGPGPCPKCGGTGKERLGSLTFGCPGCGGAGRVGGEREPAKRSDGYRRPEEGEAYDPAVHGPLPAVWEHPAVKGLTVCPRCLGAGVVINLGDIYTGPPTKTLIELPCPECSPDA